MQIKIHQPHTHNRGTTMCLYTFIYSSLTQSVVSFSFYFLISSFSFLYFSLFTSLLFCYFLQHSPPFSLFFPHTRTHTCTCTHTHTPSVQLCWLETQSALGKWLNSIGSQERRRENPPETSLCTNHRNLESVTHDNAKLISHLLHHYADRLGFITCQWACGYLCCHTHCTHSWVVRGL